MAASPDYPTDVLLDTIPDAVLLVDTDGSITYTNDRVQDLLGYEPDDILGKDIEHLVPEELREKHVLERESYVEQPTRRPMGIGLDLEARRADGSTVPVDVSLAPVEADRPGDVLAVVRDATERREYQRQITTLRQATQRLVEAKTEEEVARLVANAATDLFGYESSVFRLVEGGQYLRSTAVAGGEEAGLGDRPDYPIDEDTPVSRAYDRGEPIRHDDVRELEDGYGRGEVRSAMYVPIGKYGVFAILDLETEAFDRTDVELASGLATSAKTILDRIENERELKRQVDRLDEFAGVVSHDLRNPLNVAQGRLAMAADERSGDDLDPIAEALDRMETIVDDTLTLARQGDTVSGAEPVSIDRLADRCWGRIDRTDARLRVDDELRIHGDPDRLEHVLENLFYNAIEHGSTSPDSQTPKDTADHSDPDVTVCVGELEDEPGFYVEDNGPGIPEDEREQVFETGYTDSPDGTGFGLAIVRQIATAHGWDVRVTAGREGGARFEFTGVEFV